MKRNIGAADRWFRLGIALILFALAMKVNSWILFAFGVFTFFEAVVGWCAFYRSWEK